MYLLYIQLHPAQQDIDWHDDGKRRRGRGCLETLED
jgi:hypothetical protein